MKLLLVAGARPNFMKIAPIIHELKRRKKADWKLVHTGQHYDYEMSKVFLEELEIPEPDFFLGAGSGSHARQTARVMIEFEKVCLAEKPDVIVVVGDVNSTLACSVAAKKLHIKVAHVEAGLRSGDWEMPEEINRIVTDTVADYLFVTEKSGIDNLRSEGRPDGAIHFVGNVMIDTLYYHLKKQPENGENQEGGKGKKYTVVTLHRPSNVDDAESLSGILEALAEIGKDMPVYFPAHPRTAGNIEKFGLKKLIEGSGIELLTPMPYRKFLALWKDACLVLTDSGGLQEETTALGVPCLTVRENTERPITIEEGTNTLVGKDKEKILEAYEEFKKGWATRGNVPELWDGRAAERIVDILLGIVKEADRDVQ